MKLSLLVIPHHHSSQVIARVDISYMQICQGVIFLLSLYNLNIFCYVPSFSPKKQKQMKAKKALCNRNILDCDLSDLSWNPIDLAHWKYTV